MHGPFVGQDNVLTALCEQGFFHLLRSLFHCSGEDSWGVYFWNPDNSLKYLKVTSDSWSELRPTRQRFKVSHVFDVDYDWHETTVLHISSTLKLPTTDAL